MIDHHCHGVVTAPLDRAAFEALLTESDRPAPPGCSGFDSQLGFAVRRWCAPVLGLEPHCPPDAYLARRRELGPDEVNRRLLRAAEVDAYLVDSGYRAGELLDGAAMAAAAGAEVREIVRLEAVAEALDGVTAAGFAGAYADALDRAAAGAAGLKSIVAYRFGLDFDPDPPSRREVTEAAGAVAAPESPARRSGAAPPPDLGGRRSVGCRCSSTSGSATRTSIWPAATRC